MMTDVVVVPSLEGLLVGCIVVVAPSLGGGCAVVIVPIRLMVGGMLMGCVLLQTGAVLIILIAPPVSNCMLLLGGRDLGGMVLVMAIVPTVGEEVISAEVGAVDNKHTQYT